MFIIWWIIVGLIAGFITGKLMKGSGFGALMDIVVGIVGAIVGGFIMRALGFAGEGGLLYTILVAVIGAVLLTLLLRLVSYSGNYNGQTEHESVGERIKHFFSSFGEGDNSGHEHYTSGVERGGAIVSVRTKDEQAANVADLLD